MDWPPDFRCPISAEIMEDPVTICTGVTYERKNIEKWFFEYKKKTCPATMQKIDDFDVTPNHTLKRLIISWKNKELTRSFNTSSSQHQEMVSIINSIDSSPFKVTSLKKLKSIVEMGDQEKDDFIQSNGVDAVVNTVCQILDESADFVTFRASEEASSVLDQLPLSEGEKTFKLLSRPESMKAMAVMLQKGNAEGRLHAVSILKKMAKAAQNLDWSVVILDQGLDFFKSLLELVSDEFCTKASSCALGVLIEILGSSKKSRLKAIEDGAICVLVELLPDSSRSKCEKILLLIKLLCECAEGRLALVDHGMGIAAISKRMLHVSNAASKIGVKIFWLICNFHLTERVLEDMLVCGAVKKMLALLHLEGRSTTKDKVVRMFKMHGHSWRKYPCFPDELKQYLGFS